MRLSRQAQETRLRREDGAGFANTLFNRAEWHYYSNSGARAIGARLYSPASDGSVAAIDIVLVQKILVGAIIGYLLGSIPCAHIAARLRGRDIFATGSALAGTANVYWNIGRRSGVLVFTGDVTKGAAAALAARALDMPEHLALIVAGAAILGHWKSIFAGFRGGDGMATLMGLTVAMDIDPWPWFALVCIATGLAFVMLLWRNAYRSAWGIVACFALMCSLSLAYDAERTLVLGLTVLASLVLLRSTLTQRRRSLALSGEKELAEDIEEDIDDGLDLDDDIDGEADLTPRNG